MHRIQLAVYLFITHFLHDDLDVGEAEEFGIKAMIQDIGKETCVPVDWWEALEDWNELRHAIIAMSRVREIRASSGLQLMLRGFCDSCDGEGNCKPRDKAKGIWET